MAGSAGSKYPSSFNPKTPLLHNLIEEHLRAAIQAVAPDADPRVIQVKPCQDPRFGDYQSASLIAIAKARRVNPRQLAADVLKGLDVSAWCEPVELAGAGFLNFRLKQSAITGTLAAAMRGDHLFYRRASRPERIVIDFSSPNVAKAMHVGHIRSTNIGDCLQRILRLLGHSVVTDNHIGDWGTQFGKLLVGWRTDLHEEALQSAPIVEMERLYKAINAACETDPALLERARQELVRLQNGDPENLEIWRRMISLSREEFDMIYRRLNVRFDHTLGESFYNSRLKQVVQELRDRGLARESQGATVVFFDDAPARKSHPAIIEKSDGAANYTTTDLATLDYRREQWQPDRILYVTDGRQQLHFEQLFEIYRRWHPDDKTSLVHIWFGKVLGEDGKPFKTKSGENIKLTELLNEAEERAFSVVTEKNPALSEAERREIARVVGIGAIKYADLLPNRQSDYVFNWDKMLALTGNTVPYLQYAYTRCRSIFRKAQEEPSSGADEYALIVPQETALARHLLNFGLVLEMVAEEYRPNFLCNYLYELAGLFASFYEACPVLEAEGVSRRTRLALCHLSAAVLQQGLNGLGIETTERM